MLNKLPLNSYTKQVQRWYFFLNADAEQTSIFF